MQLLQQALTVYSHAFLKSGITEMHRRKLWEASLSIAEGIFQAKGEGKMIWFWFCPVCGNPVYLWNFRFNCSRCQKRFEKEEVIVETRVLTPLRE